jgi:hypothetical protein
MAWPRSSIQKPYGPVVPGHSFGLLNRRRVSCHPPRFKFRSDHDHLIVTMRGTSLRATFLKVDGSGLTQTHFVSVEHTALISTLAAGGHRISTRTYRPRRVRRPCRATCWRACLFSREIASPRQLRELFYPAQGEFIYPWASASVGALLRSIAHVWAGASVSLVPASVVSRVSTTPVRAICVRAAIVSVGRVITVRPVSVAIIWIAVIAVRSITVAVVAVTGSNGDAKSRTAPPTPTGRSLCRHQREKQQRQRSR